MSDKYTHRYKVTVTATDGCSDMVLKKYKLFVDAHSANDASMSAILRIERDLGPSYRVQTVGIDATQGGIVSVEELDPRI